LSITQKYEIKQILFKKADFPSRKYSSPEVREVWCAKRR